jgi:hypothetical protein
VWLGVGRVCCGRVSALECSGCLCILWCVPTDAESCQSCCRFECQCVRSLVVTACCEAGSQMLCHRTHCRAKWSAVVQGMASVSCSGTSPATCWTLSCFQSLWLLSPSRACASLWACSQWASHKLSLFSSLFPPVCCCRKASRGMAGSLLVSVCQCFCHDCCHRVVWCTPHVLWWPQHATQPVSLSIVSLSVGQSVRLPGACWLDVKADEP